MIKCSLENWTISENRTALLLFAQSFEELMALHSHDSHRVPALNFHYICFEISNVIQLIEEGILDKGNLSPLVEEMKRLFQQDPVARYILGDNFDALFTEKILKVAMIYLLLK